MKKLVLIAAIIGLSACGQKPTHEACVVSDADTYIASDYGEAGINGPNRAGVNVFNQRAAVPGFKNRRKSEFAFHYKGKGKPIEKVSCKSKKLVCEDPQSKHCQSFSCTAVFPEGFEVNVVDTPRSEFYRTEEPTYMQWDGETLKCKPT